eukprot:86084-Rhodomonas_salina.2
MDGRRRVDDGWGDAERGDDLRVVGVVGRDVASAHARRVSGCEVDLACACWTSVPGEVEQSVWRKGWLRVSWRVKCGVWREEGTVEGMMDGWMDGWMNGWMDGWMDGWEGEEKGIITSNEGLEARKERQKAGKRSQRLRTPDP